MSYHDIHAISASGLKLLAKSPAHYYAQYLDPNRVSLDQTPAMMLGSASHAAILEPEEFDNRYTVMPEGLDRRTKEGKAAYQLIIDSGKEVLSHDDMQRILKMSSAVNAHPEMVAIRAQQPAFEQEFYFDIDGMPAKMKPDIIVPSRCIIDLKTTADASPAGFAKQVWNLDMLIQAAFYSDYLQMPFNWCAVESKAPHLTAFYSCPDDYLEYGRSKYLALIDIYKRCMDTGIWPGYDTTIQPLQLPAWAESAMMETDIQLIPEEETNDE